MSDHSSSASRPASSVHNVPRTVAQYRFNWDPAVPLPSGPGSVSEATQGGQADYLTLRPPAELSHNFEAGLIPGALPSDWSSSKYGFHGVFTTYGVHGCRSSQVAISTVLNNPHKLQAPPKAHSPLPSVVLAEFPRVRRKDFDTYLLAVGPEWSRLENHAKAARDTVAQSDGSSRSDPPSTLGHHSTPYTRKISPPARVLPSLDVI